MTGPGGHQDGNRLHGEVSHVGGGVVLRLTGDLDMASASALLRQSEQLINSPILSLELHLGGVSFVDSTGISALIETRRVAKREGVQLRLVAVPRQAMTAFEVAGVADLFDFRDG